MATHNVQRETHTGIAALHACVLTVMLLFLSGCPPSKPKLLPASDLAFTGTVVVVHSSTADGLDPENSIIVNVTDVHRLPDGFTPLLGQAVSVQMNDISSAQVGEQRTFFADVVSVGAEIGAKEVSSEPAGADKQSREALTQQVKEDDMKRAEEDLRERVEKASVVALGRIVSITPMKKADDLDREHDPDWQIVELQVSSTAKGAADTTVRFLYPGSRDIVFIGYPQIQADQEWTVILNTSEEKEVGLAVALPSNILPATEFKRVESVVK